MNKGKDIKIKCVDDFELTGTLYISTEIKAASMIARATKVVLNIAQHT